MQMPTLDIRNLNPDVIRPVESHNGRISVRVSERELERIPAQLTECDTGRVIPCAVWDYTPHGFAVLVAPGATSPETFVEGRRVELRLRLSDGPVVAPCAVRNVTLLRGSIRLGLSRDDLAEVPEADAAEGRVELPSGKLEAEIRNPLLYGEWVNLELAGLAPGPRLIFTSRDPALAVFEGMELEVLLKFPTSDDNALVGKVTGLGKLSDGRLRFHMTPIRFPAELANELAETLVFEGGVSPEALKALGLPARYFRNRLDFRFAADMEEYRQVIRLRRNAYVEVGKKAAETRPESLSSKWDRRSRILCAFHENVLVASAALTFPESESVVLRSEAAFPDSKYPGGVPRKTDFIEVNSLCTHREYRKGDLLHAMFEQIARCILLSDRNHVVTLCDSNLLRLYRDIGFRDLRRTCTYIGIKHHLIVLDRKTLLYGKGMGSLAWAGLYGEVVSSLLSGGLLEVTRRQGWLIHIKLAFLPLSRRVLGARMEKVFKRRLKKAGLGGME